MKEFIFIMFLSLIGLYTFACSPPDQVIETEIVLDGSNTNDYLAVNVESIEFTELQLSKTTLDESVNTAIDYKKETPLEVLKIVLINDEITINTVNNSSFQKENQFKNYLDNEGVNKISLFTKYRYNTYMRSRQRGE